MRVLKPGGTFAVMAEAYAHTGDPLQPLIMRVLGGKCPSAEDLRDQLASIGFSAVEAFEDSKRGWLSVTAKRATTSELPQSAWTPPGPDA